MLELRIDDPAACARVEATTRGKINSLQQRLAELRHLARRLQALVGTCERHHVSEPCPILAVIAEETNKSAVEQRRRLHA